MKPFVTFVQDYHDFKIIQRAMHHAGFNVEYKEIGCGYSELADNIPFGMYHAIFYINGDNIDVMINDWKEKIYTPEK